jgi:formate hydrogenlyase subunit 3/multisubunit Na+/H+ antiporter MnhD subunit
MPQVPIILPVIITGIVLGSIIKNQKSRIAKKKLALAAVVSGLLNSAYAYADYLLTPQQATFRGFTVPRTAGSEYGFVIASFLAGFLIVVGVIGVGLLYARLRKTETTEEEAESLELTSEEESQLKPG